MQGVDALLSLFRALLGLGGYGEWSLVPGGYVAVDDHLCPLEDSSHPVVILCADWIKLVVVTSGAANRQSQKSLAHGVELLVYNIHFEDSLVR